ncbi:PRKCA-binding protein isoform X1 [Bactrocera neohumeralis]|uniref:PRKCA-binding protein isoform X1 n=2 Tax=Bactrocera tyroni species complex TaxID=98808 RepID=UPI001A97CC06|nr:PRKCA-binding protein isoform X1 [Bactrocera tryoni]XP_050320159.1 PRKCA-binding protein isoform X1 [Bactrocera neohumeralis]
MLTDTDDDYFFEEDKIILTESAVITPLLLNENSTHLAMQQQQETQNEPSSNAANSDFEVELVIDNERKSTPETDDVAQTNIIVPLLSERLIEFDRQKFELDRLGMTVTVSSVVITKDQSNLIGISIGGGSPLCPCLYIVQVFDGTPAAREGSLQSGDELLAVNSVSVKGKTKVEVAKMIQAATTTVTIHYNKLHADPEQGKSLDIILKKLKHRIVDNMSSNTADTLGLSRAILCNDSLVKRLEELEGTELMYKGLVEHARRMLKAYYDLLQTYKAFGDCFTHISAHEPQQRASEAFRMFGEFHRNLEKDGLNIIKQIKPVLSDLGTYLNKAIPDTKLTVRRYADAKFTYLSYCLKVKEMDDEEHSFAALQDPLYRVETGNYEYRLILRCRQDARNKFAKLRTDVLEKMELLECKHAMDLNKQLRSLLDSLAQLNRSVVERIEALPPLFPIEVDFKETDFQYKSTTLKPQDLDEEEEEEQTIVRTDSHSLRMASTEVVCGLEAVETPAPVVNIQQKGNLLDELDTTSDPSVDNNETLLKELGLFGVDLMSNPQTLTNQKDSVAAQNGAYDFDLFLNQSAATATQLEQDLMSANAIETDLLLQ